MTDPTRVDDETLERLRRRLPTLRAGPAWDEALANDLGRLLAAYEALRAEREWRPIESAPRDGTAFLAYGRHTIDNPPGAARGVKAGDHWWAITLYDVWREVGMGGTQFVFAKDGARTWSPPTHWRPLPQPPGGEDAKG